MFDIDTYINDRRAFLVGMLTAGMFGALAPHLAHAQRRGDSGGLGRNRSFYRVEGTVLVNGQKAHKGTLVGANDTVSVRDGEGMLAVGKDAFLLRSDTEIALSGGKDGSDEVIENIRVVTGKVLSVFGRRDQGEDLTMRTGVATIGIRGTGVYLESSPDVDYLCTCYGTVRVAMDGDVDSQATVQSDHHDAPRYLVGNAPRGRKIQKAPFKNHTDEELALIESLVGREPPFGLQPNLYRGPRRLNY